MDQSTPPGADFLQLRAETARPRGLTAWLVHAVRTAVADGRLKPGERLPATRDLARDLGISRGVVVEAYRRLDEEGLVTARTGVGTVIAPNAARPTTQPTPRPVPALLPLPQEGVDLDLSPGVPDLASFPRAAWLRAERAVMSDLSAADLGYGDPRGVPRLREELAGRLARVRGVRAGPDDLIVVAGVAQSLALLSQLLGANGVTTIATEDPGSRGPRDELVHWGLRPVAVPVDDLGIRVDALAATDVGAVLLTPAHQFPTGVVLAPGRRRELLDWAAEGRLVIEDDYDAEYRYDRAPVPAMQATAPDFVAYTGSTSKALAPGIRLGWLVPPRRHYADLVAARHASDLGSPTVPQLALARLISTGELDRYIRAVRARHRARRDALLTGLRQHLPGIEVHGAAAGLHLMVTFPGYTGEDTDMAARVAETGVRVHPLSWYRMTDGAPGLVLGYGAHSPDRLREAARRVGLALSAS
ncbi:PLP-dependent aminotransferase family protein [Actinokineospora auranticolor]|uniref:GntR family transcriptional regulator/MocR family aminotransferase n=1 Tax=Actinokineospora auranticolor TaxID=155976 RepID=A0A2S6GC40_9PSEU|nr:PLP-dependent aminotransferase family protein [Actinokineospora auranticolor]PPK62052.1 GntR family transcriptional regulator/MocR family aminotransferase [Actinokineospora auranticolor]